MTLTFVQQAAAQQQVSRHVVAPVPPPPTAPTLWVDMSNYSGALTEGMLDDLWAAGYVGTVVQAITGLNGISYTLQQLDALTRRGFRIAGYVWCFPGASTQSMKSRLSLFDGFPLEFLALDVEEVGLSRADVDRDLLLCDQYTGKKTWIYSGAWFFDLQGWHNQTWWADRELWDSSYDHVPDVAKGFVPYGGWTRRRMKQFEGTSSIGRLHQIDLNILA